MVALFVVILLLVSLVLNHLFSKNKTQIILPLQIKPLFEGLNILVVDDEAIVCKSCEKILKEEGSNVEIAMSVKSAISKLRLNNFDLIIADWKMPDKDGMYLADIIKRYFPQIPIIMITGFASLDVSIQAMQKGFVDLVSKPFGPKEIIAATQRAIHKNTERI